MKLSLLFIFLLAPIFNIFDYAFATEEIVPEFAAPMTRSIRWIGAIESRANSIREQMAQGQNITVNFCLGMRPHETDHLNHEYLNELFGPDQINFFIDMQEHKHPSETKPRKESYPTDRVWLYEGDLRHYNECYERKLQIYSANEQVGQEGRYLIVDLNDAQQRKEIARIFEGLITNFIPDGNVTGYLKLSDDSLNDYISMLMPRGKFILDSHYATGGFGIRLSVESNDIDTKQRKASMSPVRWDDDKPVYVFKTLRALIAGEYYDDSKDSLMRAPYVYVGPDMTNKLEPSLQHLVDESYLTFVRRWLGSYVHYSVLFMHVTPDEIPYLSSTASYKHRDLYVIERLS